MDTLLCEDQFFTSCGYFPLFVTQSNLVIRGMNKDLMQMQLALNIEKK